MVMLQRKITGFCFKKCVRRMSVLERFVSVIAVVTFAIPASQLFAQQSCESLNNLKLSRTIVTAATMVPTAPFSAPAGPGAAGNAAAITVPAHCEVKGTIRPSKDSEIKFAVWLPGTANTIRKATVVGPGASLIAA